MLCHSFTRSLRQGPLSISCPICSASTNSRYQKTRHLEDAGLATIDRDELSVCLKPLCGVIRSERKDEEPRFLSHICCPVVGIRLGELNHSRVTETDFGLPSGGFDTTMAYFTQH